MIDSSSAGNTPSSTTSTVFHDSRDRIDSTVSSPLQPISETRPDQQNKTDRRPSSDDVESGGSGKPGATTHGALGGDKTVDPHADAELSSIGPTTVQPKTRDDPEVQEPENVGQSETRKTEDAPRSQTSDPLAHHIVSQDTRGGGYRSTIGSEPSSTQPSDTSQSEGGVVDQKSLPPHPRPSLQESDAGLPSEPPPLNYSLRTRKLSIAFFWTLIVVDSIAIPVVLYFCLHYLTDLTPNAVFSISTGCLGGISIIEYVIRFWRLWRHDSKCRVLGARRWYLDWFHWNFSIAWIFIMIELIVGTVFDDPPIRLLAMPVSSLLWWFAFELLVMDAMRLMHKRAPLRISSIPKGEPLRPGIYPIIEDVVAVDGQGGTAFRSAFNERFEKSHTFRVMLHRLTLFWAFGCLGAAIVTTTLVFTLQREAAYVVGWALPFAWAGLWTVITFPYVQSWLKLEKKKWRDSKVV